MTLRRGLLLTCAATTLLAQEIPQIDADRIERAVRAAERIRDKMQVHVDVDSAKIARDVEMAIAAQTDLIANKQMTAGLSLAMTRAREAMATSMAFSMQGARSAPPLTADEEMKIMAIDSIMQNDAERAIPLVDKILQNQQSSIRLRMRALQALGHNNSPRAREIVARVAKDGSNTELQSRAIHLLAEREGGQNRPLLNEIYAASTNADIKRQVLRSWASTGAKEQVLNVAKSDTNPELRSQAVRQLGGMRANAELGSLYASETSPEVRGQILSSLAGAEDWQKLVDIAKTEKNEELRNRAIRHVGSMRAPGAADALAAMYGTTTDTSARGAILRSLSHERNAKQLIALARKETDPDLKRTALQHLTRIKSDEVTMYLTELLEK